MPGTLSHTSAGAEPSPLVELLRLAVPNVAQMTSYTLMQFFDTWMLARVGTLAATAAGNAGILSFAAVSFGIGSLFVVNTLVSQSYGRRDFAGCGRYLWQGVWFAVIYAAILLPLAGLIPPLFRAFGHEPALAAMETTYLRITLTTAVLKLVGTAFGQFLLATDRPGAAMVASIAGVLVNAAVAWAVIPGHFGFRSHGVAGAAWAQNAGVGTELLVAAVIALWPAARRQFNAADWKPRRAPFRELAAIGAPSGVQVVADVLAWGMFGNLVIARFGSDAMAANNFMFRYMVVSFMPAFGIGTAVTALVGRYVGRGMPDVAARRAHLGFAICSAYMLLCGLVFFAGRNRLIGLFTDDAEVRRVGAMLLVFAAVYQLFDAMYIVYNGALRGAGDTFVPAVATAVLCWGITVFGGWSVARTWPGLGVAGPWAAATIYGVILGVFMFARFRRGRWRARAGEGGSNHDAGSNTMPHPA